MILSRIGLLASSIRIALGIEEGPVTYDLGTSFNFTFDDGNTRVGNPIENLPNAILRSDGLDDEVIVSYSAGGNSRTYIVNTGSGIERNISSLDGRYIGPGAALPDGKVVFGIAGLTDALIYFEHGDSDFTILEDFANMGTNIEQVNALGMMGDYLLVRFKYSDDGLRYFGKINVTTPGYTITQLSSIPGSADFLNTLPISFYDERFWIMNVGGNGVVSELDVVNDTLTPVPNIGSNNYDYAMGVYGDYVVKDNYPNGANGSIFEIYDINTGNLLYTTPEMPNGNFQNLSRISIYGGYIFGEVFAEEGSAPYSWLFIYDITDGSQIPTPTDTRGDPYWVVWSSRGTDAVYFVAINGNPNATDGYLQVYGLPLTVSQSSVSTLLAPWNITSAAAVVGNEYSAPESFGESVRMKPDGTEVYYLVSGSADKIVQRTLSSSWDFSTVGATTKELSVGTEDSFPSSFWIKPDGTKLYVMGNSAGRIFQYTLSTPWDLSTATYDEVTAGVVFETDVKEICFDTNGLYLSVNTSSDVEVYTLSTAWDLSTLSFDNRTSVFLEVGSGLFVSHAFKDDGTKLYVLTTDESGPVSSIVVEWDLSSPWAASSVGQVDQQSQIADALIDSFYINPYTGTDLVTFSNSDVINYYEFTTSDYIDISSETTVASTTVNSTDFSFTGKDETGGIFSLTEAARVQPGRTIDSNINGSYPVSIDAFNGNFSATISGGWNLNQQLRLDLGIVDISSVPTGSVGLVFRTEFYDINDTIITSMTRNNAIEFSVDGSSVLSNVRLADVDFDEFGEQIESVKVVVLGFTDDSGAFGELGIGPTIEPTISALPSSLVLGVAFAETEGF